ncbi:MAG: DUF1846 domain-containing protein [Clostridiales bacterium]|nr:DUF1846 domain-containing protein [Clostridiales bacterium]
MKIGFDNAKYIEKQTASILERIEKYNKLYLEFGGKLFDDLHAARVLPGFDPNSKTKILRKLKDKAELIFCIGAPDIEKNKIRADFGITYGNELIRLMQAIRKLGMLVNCVVITQYSGQPSADMYRNQLEQMGEKVHVHTITKGYPNDVDMIVSDKGYGANSYIETTKPLVIVNAPGPSSGKLATCLSQIYHEYKRGINAGYAKFETFPVWNLPLKHPVNVAYEAATADIADRNMIDYFHLEAYGISAVNYNRDMECFPVIRDILKRIKGAEMFKSPTDLSVNRVADCIIDEDVIKEASRQEIIRRYYKTYNEYKMGRVDIDTALRVEVLMNSLGAKPSERRVAQAALKRAAEVQNPVVAIELANGDIVTGRGKGAINSSAAALMNALKKLAGITDRLNLISPESIAAIEKLKRENLGLTQSKLNLQEALIALAFSASTMDLPAKAMAVLSQLANCEAHSTIMLAESEVQVYNRLGINLTCESEFADS